jgi:hypothetical protein
MTIERIIVLEQQFQQLATAVPRIDGKLDDIHDALQSLVRIEERQIAINGRLSDGAQAIQDNIQRITALEIAVPKKLGERLVAIETKLPALIEMRTWVVLGILGGLGLMGTAVGSMVLK